MAQAKWHGLEQMKYSSCKQKSVKNSEYLRRYSALEGVICAIELLSCKCMVAFLLITSSSTLNKLPQLIKSTTKSRIVYLIRSHFNVFNISPSFSIICSQVQAFLVAEFRLYALGYFISENFVEIMRHDTAINYKSYTSTCKHLEVYRSMTSTQWWMVCCYILSVSPIPLIQSTSCFLF